MKNTPRTIANAFPKKLTFPLHHYTSISFILNGLPLRSSGNSILTADLVGISNSV